MAKVWSKFKAAFQRAAPVRRPPFRYRSPPSVKQLKADFRRKGWRVAPCFTVGFEFLAIKETEQKRLAIGLRYSDISGLELSLTPGLSHKEKATCVVIVNEPAPEHKATEAIERLVVLINWRDLGRVEEAVSDLRRFSRDQYLLAKLRLQAELDRDRTWQPVPLESAPHSARILYRSDYIECALIDRGFKDTLVTFGDIPDKAGDDCYVGKAASERLNWNLVCVRTFAPNWYPAHDAVKWLPVLSEALRALGGRATAFGTGQGGYGALRFARRLSCDLTVAISPTATIDPWDIEDRRYNRYFSEDLHHDMRIQPEEMPERPVLIYDPEDELDCEQIRRLPFHNGSVSGFLRFAGPASTWLLGSEDTLHDLIVSCRAQDWVGLQSLCALSRKRNSERPFTMAFALSERKPSVAARLFEKYAERTEVRRWSSVCFRLAKAGLGRRVLPAMEKAVADFPDDIPLSVSASLVALELGEARKALHLIERPLLSDGQNLTYNWIRQTARALLLPGS